HVVTAMHDTAGNVAQARRLIEQPAVGFEETLVDEIMVLHARKCFDEAVFIEARGQGAPAPKRNRLAFPTRPGTRRRQTRVPVRRGQALVEGVEKIAALSFGYGADVPIERVGINVAGAILVEPIDLALTQQEDAAQHKASDALGVLRGVSQRERRAPRAA